jgi:hypothetical protein
VLLSSSSGKGICDAEINSGVAAAEMVEVGLLLEVGLMNSCKGLKPMLGEVILYFS